MECSVGFPEDQGQALIRNGYGLLGDRQLFRAVEPDVSHLPPCQLDVGLVSGLSPGMFL